MIPPGERGAPPSSDRFRSLVEHSRDLTLILDLDGVIVYASPSVGMVLGSAVEGVVGHRLEDFVHPDDAEAARGLTGVAGGVPGDSERQILRMQAAGGAWLHIDCLAAHRGDDPHIAGITVSGRDVTERVALEEKLSYEALHDSLTGLANRVLFRDRVDHALGGSPEPGSVAVLLLDLDRFKSINDTLGHEAGDELLRVIAARLRSATRGSDTVARLGGDEFGVLLTGIRSPDDVLPVLERVEGMLTHPMRLRDRDVVPSGSVGVALSTAGVDVTELMRQADVAMYAAKESGVSGSASFFEPRMQAAAHQRARMEADLAGAIEEGGLELAYQPLFELATRTVFGLEALVRWSHPGSGEVEAAEVVRLAEETGLIVGLGRWVLHEACRAASGWQGSRPGEDALLLCVNLSARQLVDDDILTDVGDALAVSGLRPELLVLELSESALSGDAGIAFRRLAELRELGVKLAIDDYGTGHASLAGLQRSGMDVLKVDRSFIGEMGGGGAASSLVRAVLGLGAALGLRTVAEGIQTEDQLRELREMGCDYGQGFHLAPPLRAHELERFLERPEPAEASSPPAGPLPSTERR